MQGVGILCSHHRGTDSTSVRFISSELTPIFQESRKFYNSASRSATVTACPDENPFQLSGAICELAEPRWTKEPNVKPTANSVCDTLLGQSSSPLRTNIDNISKCIRHHYWEPYPADGHSASYWSSTFHFLEEQPFVDIAFVHTHGDAVSNNPHMSWCVGGNTPNGNQCPYDMRWMPFMEYQGFPPVAG
jgi:hypothetical protein